MTLDEAIRHTEDVARIKQEASIYLADEHPTQAEKCEECAKEYRQLAEWLKELKELRVRYSQLRRDCNETIDVIGKLRDELKAYKEHGGDAISRQAVLDLAEWFDLNRQHFIVANLIDEVENMPSVSPQQRTGRWIPVWERAPEERGVYLVTQKAIFPGHVFRRIVGYAPNLHDVDEYDFADKKRPGWYEYDSEWGYRELDDVIAWMPLPEPYRAESEE